MPTVRTEPDQEAPSLVRRRETAHRASPVQRDGRERPRAGDPVRLAVEAAPLGMIMVDRQGRIVFVDAEVEKLFGYAGDELIGQAIDIPERGRVDLERQVQKRTSELLTTLNEREVLLQEIHHRVKNNLQVISSFINMQARSLARGASRDALLECQTRVQAIALVHEELYRTRDYARVSFSDYTRNLAVSVFQATGLSPEGVSLALAIEDVDLAVDKAIPSGLILNELITNALKHAFPDGRSGTIRVEVRRMAGGLRLAVSDDGVGLPAGFDDEGFPSLGLKLVRMLAEQLGASLELSGAPGTCVRLTLPLEG